MQFNSILLKGILIKRYQRFLADVRLENGTTVTAHCPNSGSLLQAKEPGSIVWLSQVPASSKRKLKFTWELVEKGGNLVGINTQHPNTLVEEALREKYIPDFASALSWRREVPYGQNSRIDFLLTMPKDVPWYLEVKSVHMTQGSCALFPDSVTERGAKQVLQLIPLLKEGVRATVLYVIQRQDVEEFDLAQSIDPVYSQVIQEARQYGLGTLAYRCCVNLEGIRLGKRINVR